MDLEKEQIGKIVMFEEDGSNFNNQVEYLEKLLIESGSPDVIVGNSDEPLELFGSLKTIWSDLHTPYDG